MKREWTPARIEEWQTFYNDASRLLAYGHSGNISVEVIPHLPEYKDLKPPPCKRGVPVTAVRKNPFRFFP